MASKVQVDPGAANQVGPVREVTHAQAVAEGLLKEMRRDESIIYIGQGIGPRSGNYKQSKGLWEEFGDHRVRDTPISELGQVGLGTGAAMAGLRPIVDIVFLDMIMEAMGQVVEQAATTYYASNGQIKVPVVIRAGMGTIRSTGPHHARCFYSWFAHIPGLKVVLPSTPYDAKGLMITAIRDNGPVMFIEHKFMYNKKGPVPEGEYTIPFGRANIRRTGTDVTVIAMSLMSWRAQEAAGILEKDGISAEVIDPVTIVPLDRGTILESVKKTGRLVIVDEAQAFCGFSAELAAMVCEEALDYLDAPVRRVCALHTPPPYSPVLENAVLPPVDGIARAILETVRS